MIDEGVIGYDLWG